MKLHPLRVAVALTAALTTAASPLLVSAQTAYEFKKYTPGLVVSGTGSGQAPGSGGSTSSQLGLQLSTTAINFGNVATNTTETRQVLVSNSGTGLLSFTAAPAVMGDAAFTAGLTTCGSSLAVGADCLTDATFSPTNVGTYNGVLKFTSVLANSPHEVTLQGTAFNPVALAGATLPTGKVGKDYSYDFKQLLNVSNENTPDKTLATWKGNGTLPAGLDFNTTTGVLSGKPSAVSAGINYTVTGTYKNNEGQQVYTIKVGEAVLEVTQIAAGYLHTCALTLSGGVKCWGVNTYGQLGISSVSQSNTPVTPQGLTSGIASVVVGTHHSCALTIAGEAKCWGGGFYGQLGDGTTTSRSTPGSVSGLTSGVSSISSSGDHSCVVLVSGAAKCWGYNGSGGLGDGSTGGSRTTPVNVVGLSSGVASIFAGYGQTCAVTTAGGAKCWGLNDFGQLGNNTATNQATPVDVAGFSSGVASITVGLGHACALTKTGAVKCWGKNASGQLGDGTTINQNTPVNVSGLASSVASIDAGESHSCAVTLSGAALCWGSNGGGQLGNGTTANSSVPVSVLGTLEGISSISAGSAVTCAVTSKGDATCWGRNGSGQLGDGTTTQRTTPVNVLP